MRRPNVRTLASTCLHTTPLRFSLTIASALLVLLPAFIEARAQLSKSKAGMSGTLLIQWDGENRFIFVPDANDPLKFGTISNREIVPGRMYTDGGSIPRVFWGAKGFSPWGYGPAYVVHDWLFHQHRCKHDSPPNRYSLNESNQVLNEAIEYLMRTKKVPTNQQARSLIKWAVDKFAWAAWNDSCDAEPPAPSEKVQPNGLVIPVITVGKISF